MSIKAFGVFVICSLHWITRFKCVFSLFSTLVVLTSSFGMRLMTLLGFAVMMLCMRLLFPLNKKGLTITTGKFFKVRYFKDLPWVGRYRRLKKAFICITFSLTLLVCNITTWIIVVLKLNNLLEVYHRPLILNSQYWISMIPKFWNGDTACTYYWAVGLVYVIIYKDELKTFHYNL